MVVVGQLSRTGGERDTKVYRGLISILHHPQVIQSPDTGLLLIQNQSPISYQVKMLSTEPSARVPPLFPALGGAHHGDGDTAR